MYADATALLKARADADVAADEVFGGADVVVVTLGLIEAWRSPVTGNEFRQIPHPAVFQGLGAEFHRLTVAEMLDDLERMRTVICNHLGAVMVVTTSPVPLHATFTAHDVRIANTNRRAGSARRSRSSATGTRTSSTSTPTRWS